MNSSMFRKRSIELKGDDNEWVKIIVVVVRGPVNKYFTKKGISRGFLGFYGRFTAILTLKTEFFDSECDQRLRKPKFHVFSYFQV